jgi:hypothetical protein
MAYRVSLAAPAEADAYAAFERIRAAAPLHAEKWLTRLFDPYAAGKPTHRTVRDELRGTRREGCGTRLL